jgi:hypothetical protein
MKAILATMGQEIMSQPPYGLDLALSDFQGFGPLKVHLGGQKFQTDNELKCSVLNSLYNQDETFLLAPGTCQDNRRNVLV